MSKRLAHEGTHRELPNGHWEGRIRLGRNANSREIRIKRTAPTREMVAEKLQEARRQYNAGRPADQGLGRNPTVAAAFEHWVTNVKALTVTPKTVLRYRVDGRLFLPLLGRVRLASLRRDQLERCYATIARRGLTTDHLHRTIGAFLNWALDSRLVTVNVAARLRSAQPDRNRPEIEPLSKNESIAVMGEALRRRNWPRWRSALSLGLRQGEALGLQRDDLNLATGVLSIRRQIQRIPREHGCPDPRQCKHPSTGKRARGCDCPYRHGPKGLNSTGHLEERRGFDGHRGP